MILLPVVSTWASAQVYMKYGQIIPDPLREFWDKWELRALVITSLLSQLTLLSVAKFRKYRRDIWIRVLVWSAYMIADWVPTFAMGVISNKVGGYYDKNNNSGQKKNDMDPQLIAFWAPFFLIHLAGPHSITAYALEDSELWLRHVASLVSQTLVTCYIIILSWKSTSSWLSYLSIPMLIVGFLKYTNRIWCLYSSRISHLRDLLLAGAGKNSESVRKLFESMEFLVSLSTDVVISQSRLSQDRQKFQEASYDSAFGTIKEELDAMYDVLYTKAIVNVDQNCGTVSTILSVLGSMAVLILYTITVFVRGRRYSQMDHIITLALLIHVVVSDCIWYPEYVLGWIISPFVYGFCFLVGLYYCTVQPIVWFIKWLNGTEETGSGHPIPQEKEGTRQEKKKMRGYLLEQCNFLILTWNEEHNYSTGNYFLSMKLQLLCGNVKYPSVNLCQVSDFLREKIFIYFKNKSGSNLSFGYKYIISSKLSLQVSPTNLEFHKTIITWYIVTTLFFYSLEASNRKDLLEETKNLSDYMLFILLNLRYMLPVGAGAMTMHHTLSEAKQVFPQKQENSSEAQVATMLLGQMDTLAQRQNTNLHEESVMVEACKIAEQLRSGNRDEMLKLLFELWVEIVGYAAAHCKVENHAQQLRRGGEFLTEIWLLQAHLGLLDQFHHTTLDNHPEIP